MAVTIATTTGGTETPRCRVTQCVTPIGIKPLSELDKNTDCEPTSASRASPVYMRRCAFLPATGNSGTTRKKSHDEKSRFSRIDNDADCDLRTGVCGHRITERAVLVRCDRLFGPASGQRLQCFRSGNGRTDGRAQCVPLSWRTEIERLTFDVLDIGSRQLVQGHLHLSGRPFLRLRFAAQEREPALCTLL